MITICNCQNLMEVLIFRPWWIAQDAVARVLQRRRFGLRRCHSLAISHHPPVKLILRVHDVNLRLLNTEGLLLSKTMDAMLHALGGILLRAVPTFLLIILLHLYLKSIFFKPLEKVLHARSEATEGACRLAEQSLAQAVAKTEQYEKALYAAKTEMYQAQEKAFKDLQERYAVAIAEARASADASVKQAKALLAADVEDAKRKLAADSDALATRIADSILRRNAA